MQLSLTPYTKNVKGQNKEVNFSEMSLTQLRDLEHKEKCCLMLQTQLNIVITDFDPEPQNCGGQNVQHVTF